jgi:hypothetical protein
MNLADAVEFSKKIPKHHPKIYKGFFEWTRGNTETADYIVLSDATLSSELGSNQMEDYLKSHKIKVEQVKEFLMIYTFV